MGTGAVWVVEVTICKKQRGVVVCIARSSLAFSQQPLKWDLCQVSSRPTLGLACADFGSGSTRQPLNTEAYRWRQLLPITREDGITLVVKMPFRQLTEDPKAALASMEQVDGLRLTLDLSHFTIRSVLTMGVRVQIGEHQIAVLINDEPFTAYKFFPDQHLPYFFPVNAVGGIALTEEFPDPYPHHRSVWLGHGNVNGWDFWLGRKTDGRIQHRGMLWQESGERDAALAVHSQWQAPTGHILLTDERVFRFWQENDCRFIDATVTLHAQLPEVLLGKTNHALFCVRVRHELAVVGGGQIRNSEGGRNEKGTMGQRARWCVFFGTVKDTPVGIALFDYPSNPWHPSPWFVRDYGFMSPSPFNWGEHRLRADEPLVLRYRVVVFTGKPDLDELWQRFIAK